MKLKQTALAAGAIILLTALAGLPAYQQTSAPPAPAKKKQPTRDGGGIDTVNATEPNRGGEVDLSAIDTEMARSRLKVPEGYEINLFASEEKFPIGKAVAMTFDSRGRLWVATMPTYPHYVPGKPPEDKLVILEDTNGDGKADKHTVFADGLYLAAGFELGYGGVFVAQQPNLMFLKDTNGDDVADERRVVMHGFGTEDSHHAIHAFTWGPAGELYMHEGTFLHSQVETPWGTVRVQEAAVFRYEPRTLKLGVFVSYPFANPWGHCFDQWGQDFIADASGGSNYFAAAFSGDLDYPRKHPTMREITPVRVRPTCGCEIVASRNFPDEAQGNFLLNNTIGFHGIKQHQLIAEGSGFTTKEVEPLLQSSDINFRPVDLKFGPDGALYVVDWFNPLVGHMQYSIRDPRRDKTHGRVWRITYKNRPLVKVEPIEGKPIPQLLDLLKSYEARARYRVRRELWGRDPKQVAPALKQWVAALDASDSGYEHNLLEALWLYQSLDVVESDLLARVLRAKDHRARAAATRVIRYWNSRLSDSVSLLRARIHDEHPLVRLEAAVALSFFRNAEAAETALEVLDHPTDYYLEYGLKETLATLEPVWRPLLSSGKPLGAGRPKSMDFLLAQVSSPELLKFAPNERVYETVLGRGEAPHLRTALAGLASLKKTSPAAELVAALRRADPAGGASAAALASALSAWEISALQGIRPEIEALAQQAKTDAIRRGAYAAWIRLDGTQDNVWPDASRNAASLADMLEGIGMLPEPDLRERFYPRVRALIGESDDDRVRRAAIRAMGRMPASRAPEIFQTLASVAIAGTHIEDAVAVMRALPKESWQGNKIRPLVDSLLAYAGRSRNQQLVAFGQEVAALLPAADAEKARRSFDDFLVQTIVVKAVPKELRFEPPFFVVEAGRPVEIVLENPDVMPHNLLVTTPGSLEKVGKAGDAMASLPDAFKKHFVPALPEVLWSTPLIDKDETARVRFTAPEATGAYPYVCTFPGHWMTMNGQMYVRTRGPLR